MIKVISETIAWDAIPGSTSYDILINGVKKSSTTTALKAAFTLTDGDIVRVVAQPSGEWQEITFDYSVEIDTPPPAVTSPDNTVIKKGDGKSIVDGNKNTWTITADGKVSVNGIVDAITSSVIQMAYESKKIWQQNSNNAWWYKLSPTDTWLPTGGTMVSPIPGVTPVSSFHFGISPGTPYSPNLATQFPDYRAIGADCPRIGVGAALPDGNSEAAIAAGITKWIVWAGNSGYMWTPSQAVAYCRKYPQCIGIELGNELNLNGAWTAQKVVDMQNPFYDAMKAAGLEAKVMLPSIGNGISAVERLSMLDWSKKVHSLGIRFTIANYHNYGADPVSADTWQECWTVGRHGTSCQIVFNHPPFAVTEFGDKIGWSDCPDAATQARAAALWINHLSAQPNFFAGHWFLMDDGSAWTGFGLRDGSGNKRPSYTTYHDAVAGHLTARTLRATMSDVHESALRPTDEELAEFAAMKQMYQIQHAAHVSN